MSQPIPKSWAEKFAAVAPLTDTFGNEKLNLKIVRTQA